jgi:peptidoglycan/LPS O-acetylase OafA/YrhL
LGIEEKFYLVWPLLAFGLLARSKYRLWVTVGLTLGGILFMLNGGWLAQMWGAYTDILIGCVLAQLLHQRSSYEKIAVLGRPALAWSCVALLALATLWTGTGTQLGERLYSFIGAVALAAIVTNQRGPADYASAVWLRAIGTWSYAIYLTHALIIPIVEPFFPESRLGDILSLIGTLSLVMPLCGVLHVVFEQPLINLGRRLAQRSAKKASAEASYVSDSN